MLVVPCPWMGLIADTVVRKSRDLKPRRKQTTMRKAPRIGAMWEKYTQYQQLNPSVAKWSRSTTIHCPPQKIALADPWETRPGLRRRHAWIDTFRSPEMVGPSGGEPSPEGFPVYRVTANQGQPVGVTAAGANPLREAREQLEQAEVLRRERKLDKAESVCTALLRRYPDY